MNKRSLEEAFNAYFHRQDDFQIFRSLNISNETTKIKIGNTSLYKTSDQLKKYLVFINKVILKYILIESEVVHSYIKNKSTLTALEPHSKSKYFFKTDLNGFFKSITKSDVEEILERSSQKIPISNLDSHKNTIIDFITINNSLPVGFPTSPIISNSFLYYFDKKISSYCLSKNLIYSRYSDDMIISSFEKIDISEIKKYLTSTLSETSEKLSLNEEKTYLLHKGNKIKLLGLIITPNGKITIDSKQKRVIEALIYFYKKDEKIYKSILENSFQNSEKVVFGQLNYIKSVDPIYLEKLECKYGYYKLSLLMSQNNND